LEEEEHDGDGDDDEDRSSSIEDEKAGGFRGSGVIPGRAPPLSFAARNGPARIDASRVEGGAVAAAAGRLGCVVDRHDWLPGQATSSTADEIRVIGRAPDLSA
jgi:hypothetical protein